MPKVLEIDSKNCSGCAEDNWKCCFSPEEREGFKTLGNGSSGDVLGFKNIAVKSVDLDPLRPKSPSEAHDLDKRKAAAEIALWRFTTQEAPIAKVMSNKGVGPKVFEIFISENDNYGVIKMERLSESFAHALPKIKTIEQLSEVEKLIDQKLNLLIDAGYTCVDMRPENIMILRDDHDLIDDVALIDFGDNFCSIHGDADPTPAHASKIG